MLVITELRVKLWPWFQITLTDASRHVWVGPALFLFHYLCWLNAWQAHRFFISPERHTPMEHLLIWSRRWLMITQADRHSLVTTHLLSFQITRVISIAADVRRIWICSSFSLCCRPGLFFSGWINVICDSARIVRGFWTKSHQLALSQNAAVSVFLECLPL